MPTSQLTVPDNIQREIRRVYAELRERYQLRSRPAQRQMIAKVAAAACAAKDSDSKRSVISADPFLVVNALTGAGKSLGYAIPTIIAAMQTGKVAVLATATVALQEQLANKDLPMLAPMIPNMTVAVVKGRNRHLCVSKVSRHLRDGTLPVADEQRVLKWRSDLAAETWQGDMDSLAEAPERRVWMMVASESSDCTGQSCSDYAICPYYRARAKVSSANVVVANIDLLLTESIHGGGALPNLDRCIVAIDEAHKLPETALKMLETTHNVTRVGAWVDSAQRLLARVARMPHTAMIANIAREGIANLHAYNDSVMAAQRLLANEVESAMQSRPPKREEDDVVVPYAGGHLPKHLKSMATNCAQASATLAKGIEDLRKAINGPDSPSILTTARDALLVEVAAVGRNCQQASNAWESFAAAPCTTHPCAKWLQATRAGQIEIHVNCSPLTANRGLYENLWSKVAACVLCSGTVKAAGSFDPFLTECGLDLLEGKVKTLDLPSPFDYPNRSRLIVPRMKHTPKDEGHAQEAQQIINEALTKVPEGRGVLMLFTSWSRLKQVCDSLPAELQAITLRQGTLGGTDLLKQHAEAIKAGRKSIVAGTAAFEQGLDLPGALCELVIIDKLPFPMPTNPVDVARMEWMRARGVDHFSEVVLPATSRRLQQCTGRLLRTESDMGTVIVLDTRLVTARFGRSLIESLPPMPVCRELDLLLA